MNFASSQDHFWQSSRNTDAMSLLEIMSLREDAGEPHFPYDAITSMTDEIAHSSKTIRLEKIQALTSLSHKYLQHYLSFLLSLCIDEDEDVRMNAIDLLARLRDHVPVSILLNALTDVSWKVRAAAAQALGNRQYTFPAQEMLLAFEKEQDMTVREMIVKACKNHYLHIPVSWFTNILYYDPFWLVREAAAEALGSWGPQMPLLPLFHTVQWDEDENVRAAAARSLGKSWRKQAESILYAVLEHDPDEDVVQAAATALQEIDKETRGLSYISRLAHPFDHSDEMDQKYRAFRAIAQLILTKQGYINRNDVQTVGDSYTLCLNCIYQQSEHSFLENILPVLDDQSIIQPIEAAIQSQDHSIHRVLVEGLKYRETRHWQDFFIISFSFHQTKRITRVILSGMSCQRVRHNDVPVLDQLYSIVREALPGLTTNNEELYNLTDLKVWHQANPEPSMAC